MAATKARNAAGALRLFFALWPDDELRARLAALTAQVSAECGGRPTAAANLHATLVFLGSVPEERVAEFIAMAESLRAAAFELVLDTLGYWRHNRIVWAGARRSPPPLVILERRLKRGVEALRWPVDERPYFPHVTLLRDARRGPAVHTAPLPLWRVREFALVSSTQRCGGVRYAPLQRWPLKG